MGNTKGMTILEVVIALTIFMIGIGFLVQSDAVSFRYRAQRELRQQMLFYAAGQTEALLEGQNVSDPNPPFTNFSVQTDITEVNPQPSDEVTLEQVRIAVTSNAAGAPEPVSIYTYRIKP
ncbi:MAG: type IV pilus modification PilV family protein [Desulfitobacteriaceae bacterium]